LCARQKAQHGSVGSHHPCLGLRVKGYTWMGEQSLLETKCLAERNDGLYLTVETEDELREAFEKTLCCPMVTELQVDAE
jgi:Ca-activated chloride channel family protein